MLARKIGVQFIVALLVLSSLFLPDKYQPVEASSLAAPQAQLSLIAGRQYKIVSALNGLAVDLLGWSIANESPIAQWEWLNNDNQKWTFEALGGDKEGDIVFILFTPTNASLFNMLRKTTVARSFRTIVTTPIMKSGGSQRTMAMR